MRFIDTLRKLGVLRFGSTSGVYHSAKDRPAAFMDDTVYDAQKDGVSTEAITKAVYSAPAHKWLLVVSVALGILFLFFSLTSTVWWLVWILWIVWIIILWRVRAKKLKLPLPLTLLFAVVVCFSFFLIIFTQTKTPSSNSSKIPTTSPTKSAALTAAQCQPYVQKYNNKVYKLSADGLQGTLAFKIDTANGCELQYWYNTLIAYELPQNAYTRDEGRVAYYYTMMLRKPDQSSRTKNDDVGTLSVVRKNQTIPPAPYDTIAERAKLYIGDTPPAPTQYFSWGYMSVKNFSEDAVKELLDKTKLEIIDGLPYIEERTTTVGGQTSANWGVNSSRATTEGRIVKTYDLVISE